VLHAGIRPLQRIVEPSQVRLTNGRHRETGCSLQVHPGLSDFTFAMLSILVGLSLAFLCPHCRLYWASEGPVLHPGAMFLELPSIIKPCYAVRGPILEILYNRNSYPNSSKPTLHITVQLFAAPALH
jgi:hypothetical protein